MGRARRVKAYDPIFIQFTIFFIILFQDCLIESCREDYSKGTAHVQSALEYERNPAGSDYFISRYWMKPGQQFQPPDLLLELPSKKMNKIGYLG
jgi:hypothetical protein